MLATEVPYTIYFDLVGKPLQAGYVYFGIENGNPETDFIPVFWDAAGTQPVAQPVRTLNGYPVRSGTIAQVYCNSAYSVTVREANGKLVRYAASSADFAVSTFVTNFLATLAGATGASYIGTSQSGAGAIARTQIAKNSEIITDADFSTLQQFLDAIAGSQGRITKNWSLITAVTPSNNTTIIIDALASVTTAAPDIHVFDCAGKSNIHIQGFGKISSTATTGTLSRKGLVNFTGSTDCDVTGIELVGMQWAGVLIGTGSVNCWVYNCRIHDFLATVQDCAGVQIIDGAVNCGVRGGSIANSGWHAVNVQETGGGLVPKGTLLEGIKISGAKSYGINCYNKTASTIDQNTTIRDCDVSDVQGGAPYNSSSGAGVYIQSAGNVRVFGGTIANCCWGTQDNSLTPAGIGIALTGVCTRALVEGVTFINMGFKPDGTQNPNAVTVAAISVNSGVTGANIGPCTVRQSLANTAGAFAFVGYYINANSNVSITQPTMDINPLAVGSTGIFIFANTLDINTLSITGGTITGCDFAQIRVDQNPSAGPVVHHVSNLNIANITLVGGSANCQSLAISQAIAVNGTTINASATTVPALALSASTGCTFTSSRLVSTGTSAITTSGACTGSIIEETVSFGADSKMNNAGTGCQVRSVGAAAPAAGTWAVNDVRRINPIASGSPVFQGCKGAGVPGTWTPSGNWT